MIAVRSGLAVIGLVLLLPVPALAINCPAGTSQTMKIPAPPSPPVSVPYPVCIENGSMNKKLPMPPRCNPPKFPVYKGGWSCMG